MFALTSFRSSVTTPLKNLFLHLLLLISTGCFAQSLLPPPDESPLPSPVLSSPEYHRRYYGKTEFVVTVYRDSSYESYLELSSELHGTDYSHQSSYYTALLERISSIVELVPNTIYYYDYEYAGQRFIGVFYYISESDIHYKLTSRP